MGTLTNDTIVAISTPIGENGIGIVRISGENAFLIIDDIFRSVNGKKPSRCKSHRVYYGHIVNGENEVVDEVIVTIMKKPNTYTVENVVEINCHGGRISLKEVLEICVMKGARIADPGEFTKRAFLNGRIDLSQAEAVMDLISSETEAARRNALEQLKGKLSEDICSVRNEISEILSYIELGIDFSQEDVEFVQEDIIGSKLTAAKKLLKKMYDTCEKGMILKEGASIVICGRPNVGKSSLMNSLLKHDRVIVTPIAGTTRDVIEEHININGVKVKISDTAGIIETNDRVELEGIRRSKEKLLNAEIVIFMLDSSRLLSVQDEEIYKTVAGKKKVIVLNKCDLERKLDAAAAERIFSNEKIYEISALKGEGLDSIEDAISRHLLGGEMSLKEDFLITNSRHRDLIRQANEALQRAEDICREDYKGELAASDLNEVLHYLGFITGETVSDDILDRIFSKFCIGK